MQNAVELGANKLTLIANEKYDMKDAVNFRNALEVAMKRFEFKTEEIKNEVLSLENYVEKYVPLRIQQQIGQAVVKFIGKNKQIRFMEMSNSLCTKIRNEIVKDNGSPRIHERCLGIITEMRLEEEQIFNKHKKPV